MKEQIKELRVKIDGLAQLTKELKPITNLEEQIVIGSQIVWDKKAPRNSKEIEKAVDSLYLGKAWLGKLLGELGNENPYGSGYKTKEDIVPTQDVAISFGIKGEEDYIEGIVNKFELEWFKKNHIEKVDWLRTEIQEQYKYLSALKALDKGPLTSKNVLIKSQHTLNLVFQYLLEARFWLGFELERIKNEK